MLQNSDCYIPIVKLLIADKNGTKVIPKKYILMENDNSWWEADSVSLLFYLQKYRPDINYTVKQNEWYIQSATKLAKKIIIDKNNPEYSKFYKTIIWVFEWWFWDWSSEPRVNDEIKIVNWEITCYRNGKVAYSAETNLPSHEYWDRDTRTL